MLGLDSEGLKINEWDLCLILSLLIFAPTIFLQPRCQDLPLGAPT